jgi:hypothetical protein
MLGSFLWNYQFQILGHILRSASNFFIFKFKFPILKTTPIFKIKKIILDMFQGWWISQNFASLVFKGGFYKSIIINQGFLFFVFFL